MQDTCEQLGHSADQKTIICDFEQAAMNAVTATFGQHVSVQGCFYHLTQSTWRKVQELGMATAYRDNQDLRQFIGMIDGLAFLPVSEVADGMKFLRANAPVGDAFDGLGDLLDYFDATYVSGASRVIRRPAASHRIQPIRIRKTAPLFSPALWNVHEATLSGSARTNNFCESWNNGFAGLVGHSHPSLWVLLRALQEDEATASTSVLQTSRGQPPVKRVKRSTQQLQERLQQLCCDRRDGRKSMEETLRGLGFNIRLI